MSRRLLRSAKLYGTAALASMLGAIVGVYLWRIAVDYTLISIILVVPIIMVAGLVVTNYYFLSDILRKRGIRLPFKLRGYIAFLMVFPFLIRFLHPDFAGQQMDFINEFLYSNAR